MTSKETSSLIGLFPVADREGGDGAEKRISLDVQDLDTRSSTDSRTESGLMTESYQGVIEEEGEAGSIHHMMNLFSSKGKNGHQASEHTKSRPSLPRPALGDRQPTAPRSNRSGERTPLLASAYDAEPWEKDASDGHGSFRHSDSPTEIRTVNSQEETPKTVNLRKAAHTQTPSALPAIREAPVAPAARPPKQSMAGGILHVSKRIAQDFLEAPTYVGSLVYVLYHVVFALTIGSAIHRPNNPVSLLGLITKTASLGIIFASPVFWIGLGSDIPALYPSCDLFAAPFLANIAVIIDETLAKDQSVEKEDNDVVFLTTFAVLCGIGILVSGSLLVLAGVFKLANLGSFLPFPVICGFFSAVGIMTWTLAFSVDNHGRTIGRVIFSGDIALMLDSFIHHVPSLCIAVVMNYLGPLNPIFVCVVVLATIVLSYLCMFFLGVTLEEAKADGWFWSHDELVYVGMNAAIGFEKWSPPAPFGFWNEMAHGRVHWGAVYNGLSTTIALGFLYLIRCSIHAAALKKNVSNLQRRERRPPAVSSPVSRRSLMAPANSQRFHQTDTRTRLFSDMVDLEAVWQSSVETEGPENAPAEVQDSHDDFVVIQPQPTNISLKNILLKYGYSQFISALVGGYAIAPSVAASPTMYSLGAEKVAPQMGAAFLVFVFYMTDFQIVSFIPKCAFSSMLVLAFLNMISTWFFQSFFKTKDKFEWLVVPAIVVCAFALGLLTSVFVGIALSTFIFVGAINRSGTVKFVATGETIHSTIERPPSDSEWLEENGASIVVITLQNYLFFGNATSMYNFISSMFAEPKQRRGTLPNSTEDRVKPKFVIISLNLVSGMDTSTVDIFKDTRTLCANNDCKLFLAGISSDLRTILSLGGFKPEVGDKSKRKARFFSSLDNALGKAEDLLLRFRSGDVTAARQVKPGHYSGFVGALQQVDDMHGDNAVRELAELEKYTSAVSLEPGNTLYAPENSTGDLERGLFFIESGILKVERSSDMTGTARGTTKRVSSLTNLATLDRPISFLAEMTKVKMKNTGSSTFRLARLGPGWIAGTLEALSHMRRQGDYVAVTSCRLHHLPYSVLAKIEKEEPALALNLYKVLSFSMARQQEATISQLATVHSIMSSPAIAKT